MSHLRRYRQLLVVALISVTTLGGCSDVAKTDCNDGLDNDGDGLIDATDPGCANTMGMAETPDPPRAQCSNALDDDGDGLTDFPNDPGCMDANDDNEVDPPPPPPECNDGLDNNGNGLMDYPFDSGCDSMDDTTEDSPPPVTQCSDGLDNDGDGFMDYPAEPGCTSAADNDEYNPIVGECGPSIDVQPFPGSGFAEGDRTGPAPNELQSPFCAGLGQEFVWTYEVTTTSALLVTTNFPETTLDTVVYVRGLCRMPDTELGCDDDDPPDHASTLVIPRVEPGTYYVVVDSYGPGSLGHFKLQVEPRVAQGEACDPAIADVCAPGLICRSLLPGDPTTCEFHECGDGLDNDTDGTIDYPDEAGCDTIGDDTELIAPGDPIPECGNGLDDDGDGFIDFAGSDPGCAAAADTVEIDECQPGLDVLPLPITGATGTTAGAPSLNFGTCDPDSMMANERVHAFKVLSPLTKLHFSTAGSTFANVLYVRQDDCAGGVEVACAPNNTGTLEQAVTINAPVLDATYFVFVDGDWESEGTYSLSVSGEIPGGEACVPGATQFLCTAGFMCDAGTSLCVPATCNDTMDNDGDGFTDYPNDPGCQNSSDASETDPPVAPACADGADNDGDGDIDFAGGDPGCTSAADNNEIDQCIAGVDVLDLPEAGATGTTSAGALSNFTASCFPDSSMAPEHVYAFTLNRNLTRITFSTLGPGTNFDDVLFVRRGACNVGPDVACANARSAPGESVDIINPPQDDYFVFIDGNWTSFGNYQLAVSGVIAAGEGCDPASTAFLCTGGTVCRPATNLCEPTQCNDGVDNGDAEDSVADVADPGCDSILDDDETNPAILPQCGDTVDNDGDGFTDWPTDPGCARASDDLELDCLDTDPIVNVSHLQTYAGSTSMATNDHTPSCSLVSTAKDVVHTLTIPGHLDTLQVDTNSSALDTIVYLKYGGCDEVDYACDDDTGTGSASLILRTDVPAGTYFIVVDGWNMASGSYNLHITGTITAGAACDPLQAVPGFLPCAVGTTCMNPGSGFVCL